MFAIALNDSFCYRWLMDLNTYLSPSGSAAELSRKINVPPALMSQWRTGKRSVPPKWCAAIEKATCGAVSRVDLRPNDWRLIWPELESR